MNSHDGEGGGGTLRLGETISNSHRLGGEFCRIELQVALNYLEYARETGDDFVLARAVLRGRETLARVRLRLGGLQLAPVERERIEDLIAVVSALLEPGER